MPLLLTAGSCSRNTLHITIGQTFIPVSSDFPVAVRLWGSSQNQLDVRSAGRRTVVLPLLLTFRYLINRFDFATPNGKGGDG